jgi:hypothetical protein
VPFFEQNEAALVDVGDTDAPARWPLIGGGHRQQEGVVEQAQYLEVGTFDRQRQHHTVVAGSRGYFACSRGNARQDIRRADALLAAVAVHPICPQRVRLRHGDDVVAGIDEMDFAGDAGRQIRQEIQASAAQFLQRDAAAER